MKQSQVLIGAILPLLLAPLTVQGYNLSSEWEAEFNKTTYDRIRDHGYPAETHHVYSEGDYILTMFRIPYSHNLGNQHEKKPAVLLQHGTLSSSDGWVLSGPNDALAFLLADAGYDVWLGNARGNRYSRNNTRLSPKNPLFWQFSWHEIGIYDMAAMIDYILENSGNTGVHYVGHSQGTTVFFVLTSSRPEYNEKIKTAHLLAPSAFVSNVSTPAAKYAGPILGHPSTLTRVLDTQEIMPSALFYLEIYDLFCTKHPALKNVCKNLLNWWNGDPVTNGQANSTVYLHMNETHPAGASSTQVLHYMQEYESGHFRQFDFGEKKNLAKYGQSTPPDYDVLKITAELHFYYSDGDELCSVINVEYLATLLPKKPKLNHIAESTFTHADFQWALRVKELINEPVIKGCNLYEEALNNKL